MFQLSGLYHIRAQGLGFRVSRGFLTSGLMLLARKGQGFDFRVQGLSFPGLQW